jgi:hypothetical protein
MAMSVIFMVISVCETLELRVTKLVWKVDFALAGVKFTLEKS